MRKKFTSPYNSQKKLNMIYNCWANEIMQDKVPEKWKDGKKQHVQQLLEEKGLTQQVAEI